MTQLRRALIATAFFLTAGSATAGEPFGTPGGCLIGTDDDAALDLIEAGDPAVVLEGTHIAYPALGQGCELSSGENLDTAQGVTLTHYHAICYVGDREWIDSFTIAVDGDKASVTDSKGGMFELTRCTP